MPVGRRLLLLSLLASPVIAPALGDVAPEVEAEGPVPDLVPAPAALPSPIAAPAAAPPAAVASPAAAAPAQVAQALPTWRRNAVRPPALAGRPAITVVIDDMGFTHPHTERALALPGPLTLSWFPFSPRLAEQVAAGAARGHEATLHMPMQSFSNSILQTGPDPLRIDLPPEINLARLKRALDAVPNTVGLNNHMGSVATRDPALMDIVAAETRARGMLFLDSITIPHSVALSRAEAAGVPAAGRDIFIDWKMKPEVIATQLAEIEAHARRYGHVIAIGHPRKLTLEALEAWLPTLPGKGFALWPLAATVAWRNRLDFPMA